jgi:hypothetical protein
MQAISSPINILGKHLGKTVHDIELRAFKQPPDVQCEGKIFQGRIPGKHGHLVKGDARLSRQVPGIGKDMHLVVPGSQHPGEVYHVTFRPAPFEGILFPDEGNFHM